MNLLTEKSGPKLLRAKVKIGPELLRAKTGAEFVSWKAEMIFHSLATIWLKM